MKKKKDRDPRPVREPRRYAVLPDADVYSVPIAELSAHLLRLMREKGLTEDEIKTANLDIELLGYDPAQINVVATAMETLENYELRLQEWERRQELRQEEEEAARKLLNNQRARDEAEFERLRKKLGKTII